MIPPTRALMEPSPIALFLSDENHKYVVSAVLLKQSMR